MKYLRRLLNPPRIHMGPHGNEMCDHGAELTAFCNMCEIGFAMLPKLRKINTAIIVMTVCFVASLIVGVSR